MTERTEWLKCAMEPGYFIDTYCQIYNATERSWIPFSMWPAQFDALDVIEGDRQVIVLKARQLGLSWLALCYSLWLLLFRPVATVLLFSKRLDEARELIGDERLKGIYARLPEWMRCRAVAVDSASEFVLSNGSRALAFPTTGGRSYTGSFALVDEADFIPNLSEFLNAVKPTIDAGGQLLLVSTVDKSRPTSTFKSIFRAATKGLNEYRPFFLPWSARPGRTQAWYESVKADMFAQDGSDDNLFQEYPATVEEALAPRQLDKRVPFSWIEQCHDEVEAVDRPDAPAIGGLRIYLPPVPGRQYVMGADPAEGNPNSDPSSLTVMDAETWVEVAHLSVRAEPGVFAGYIDQVGVFFHDADVLPERNNHGHAVILALQESGKLRVLDGFDGRAGWLSNVRGKPLMYDAVAEALRDKSCVVRTGSTVQQLASIEASALRAPEGLHDDEADSFALCIAALRYCVVGGEESSEIPAVDPLEDYDRGGF